MKGNLGGGIWLGRGIGAARDGCRLELSAYGEFPDEWASGVIYVRVTGT